MSVFNSKIHNLETQKYDVSTTSSNVIESKNI